ARRQRRRRRALARVGPRARQGPAGSRDRGAGRGGADRPVSLGTPWTSIAPAIGQFGGVYRAATLRDGKNPNTAAKPPWLRRHPRIGCKTRRRGSQRRPFGYAAFFSRSCFHCPRVARPFIMARWVKARWAAATFSLLPDQAFCGAACSARP